MFLQPEWKKNMMLFTFCICDISIPLSLIAWMSANTAFFSHTGLNLETPARTASRLAVLFTPSSFCCSTVILPFERKNSNTRTEIGTITALIFGKHSEILCISLGIKINMLCSTYPPNSLALCWSSFGRSHVWFLDFTNCHLLMCYLVL